MSLSITNRSALFIAGFVFCVALTTPLTSKADTVTPTLTASQTAAGVTEVKANRIINVLTAPAATETITIGSCIVTFATTTGGVGAQDVNCGDNAATIRTATTSNDVAKTAVQIAAELAVLNNVSASSRSITAAAGTTTSKVSFTTTSTESSATAITFTDGTTGDIVSAGSTTGVIPVNQTVTFTPASLGATATFNVTLNATTYSVRESSSASVQNVVESLDSQIGSPSGISCSEDDAKVSCVAAVAGTDFTYSSEVTEIEQVTSGGSGSGGGSSHRSSRSSNSDDDEDDDDVPAANTGTTTATPAAQAEANASANAAFNRDLTVGTTGDDVMALQKYLNAKGYTVAATGPGSAGSETSMFGALTRAALVKLQIAAGITPAAGYFGPKTRAYIAAN